MNVKKTPKAKCTIATGTRTSKEMIIIDSYTVTLFMVWITLRIFKLVMETFLPNL